MRGLKGVERGVFTQDAVTHQQVSKISEPELSVVVASLRIPYASVCVRSSERNPSKFLFWPVASVFDHPLLATTTPLG